MVAYTETDVLLKIENVCKSYGGKVVLRDVSAVIRDIHIEGEVKGQVVGFIGPSGIGKSTLFRIMAGLEAPDSGRVVLDGLDRPVAAGEVGVVAQSYPLFNHRTVFGNLSIASKGRSGLYSIVDALTAFDLMSVAQSYPAQLSGGQRQRVAILQQFLSGNEIVLMDEPFSGLDIVQKKKAQELITRVANLSERNTIVVCTHDIASAAAVADHIWCLGRESFTDRATHPGAKIVESYNLIDRDICWRKDIEREPEFMVFVQELSERFKTL